MLTRTAFDPYDDDADFGHHPRVVSAILTGINAYIMLDNGANLPLTNRREVFRDGLIFLSPHEVTFGNKGKSLCATGARAFGMPEVYYDPDCGGTYLAQCDILKFCYIETDRDGRSTWVTSRATGEVEYAFELRGGLYHLRPSYCFKF